MMFSVWPFRPFGIFPDLFDEGQVRGSDQIEGVVSLLVLLLHALLRHHLPLLDNLTWL